MLTYFVFGLLDKFLFDLMIYFINEAVRGNLSGMKEYNLSLKGYILSLATF
jgi:hypothetical protein